jgi:hypothetical protein
MSTSKVTTLVPPFDTFDLRDAIAFSRHRREEMPSIRLRSE